MGHDSCNDWGLGYTVVVVVVAVDVVGARITMKQTAQQTRAKAATLNPNPRPGTWNLEP